MNLSRTLRKLTPPRVLKVLTHPDPRLQQTSRAVDLNLEPEFDLLLRDMIATMRKFEGLGLAAIQVGIPKRFFVYDDSEKQDDPRVLVNPRIIARSDELANLEEGCLSFPGLYRPVERAASVTVIGLDHEGEPVEFTADGLLARVIEHEIDHLDGINFITLLSNAQRKAALREYFDLAPTHTGG